MNELELTLAIHDYDHTRDLVSGRVPVTGVRLRTLELTPPEINGRFTRHGEWDVSEYGLGKYVARRAAGDDSITAIPVFPARSFRHSCIYVRADSDLTDLGQLAGRRVGIPEWAQTAVIYARGLLAHEHGVDLASIRWSQAGVNEPGRVEKVAVALPPGVHVEARPDATLQGLLQDGAVDAIITAQPPAAFEAGDQTIRRLLRDPEPAERAYYAATGIFPIMHTVAIRREVYDRHPWIAINLLAAFQAAKARSLARLADAMGPRVPLAWIGAAAERERATFGADLFPYGIEPNRITLEAFLGYAAEQGITSGGLSVDDLFAPTVRQPIRI